MDPDLDILGLQRDLYHVVGGEVEFPAWIEMGYDSSSLNHEGSVNYAVEEFVDGQGYSGDSQSQGGTALDNHDIAVEMVRDMQAEAEETGLLEDGGLTAGGARWHDRTCEGMMSLAHLQSGDEGMPESRSAVGGIYSALAEPEEGEPRALVSLLDIEKEYGIPSTHSYTVERLYMEGLVEDVDFDSQELQPSLTRKGETVLENIVKPDHEFLRLEWGT